MTTLPPLAANARRGCLASPALARKTGPTSDATPAQPPAWMRARPPAWATAFVLVVLIMVSPVHAQPVDIPATWGGTLGSRPRLTGSWGELRDTLGKHGVVLDVDLLQLPQAVASGGRDEVARYFGLAEYTLHVDTQKLGLWPGGFLQVQGMSGFGQSVDRASGAFIPTSLASLLPEPGETATGLMNLTFTQFLSPHVAVVAGKMSGLTADDNAFAHDYHTTFVNAALDFNMAAALFPLTAFGGGLIVLPWEGAVFSAAALDPDGTATNNDISEAFKDGVLVAAEGRVTIKPFGLVGHQLVGGGWSNKERLSLQQDPSNLARLLLTQRFPRLADPGADLAPLLERFFPELLVPTEPLTQVDSTWAIYYNFDQYLWSPEGHPDRGIGVFFRFGASDGVANPIKYTYNVGIGSKGLVPGRPSDTFGVGWARTELSEHFVPFLRQELRLGLGHEDAIELYYNAAIAHWLNAALNLQIIDQALARTLDASGTQLRDLGTAVIVGLRVYARF
jgi:porin